MENLFVVFAACVALFLLLAIAEPYRFIPAFEARKRKVGSTYWGVYQGTPSDEPEGNRTIELQAVTRKEPCVVGSSSYSKGKGVSMSGRG